jgi:hypothetical protein
MSDPQMQSQAQEQGVSLWEQAPGWRNLVIGASLLTAVAVALPVMLQGQDDTQTGAAAPRHHHAAMPTPPAISVPPPMHAAIVPPAALVAPAPTSPAPVIPSPAPHNHIASLAPPPAAPASAQPQVQAAPASQPQICLLVMPPAPQVFGSGMVIGFENHATSMARIQMTQAHTGGLIDPGYIDNQRVTVKIGNGHYQIFLVPRTMQVQLGDRVTVQGGYRNINLPCNYVPNLVTADLGQAPQAAAPVAEGAPPP